MAERPPTDQIVGAHHALYESLFQQADSKKSGLIIAIDAVGFLKQSNLPQDILAGIWDKADKGAKGYLDFDDFCVALKLIALAQSSLGLEPSIENLGADVLPPNLGEASRLAETTSVSVSGTWEVSASEQAKYYQVFQSLGPTDGVLSGSLCRQVFMKSKLPVDVLGKIWELSDIDRDGALDREEFILAMHLVYKVSVEKQHLPNVLDASLIPPSKVNLVLTKTTPSSSQQDIATLAPIKVSPPAPPPATATWVVTPAEKTQYDTLFQQADVNKVGYLTGAEARDILMKSGLPPAILAHIWQLCDSSGSGKLLSDQFALAMYLTNARLRGVDLPVQLTPEMIPPSQRTPAPAAAGPNEFPENKELQELSAEVEAIRKERQAVEADIEHQQSEVNRRHTDLTQLQREVDQLANLLQQLEQQKAEAQKRLDELDEQRNRCQRAIEEVHERRQEEQTECLQLQQNISDFNSQSQDKQQELAALRQNVENIRAQERQIESGLAQQRQASQGELAETSDVDRQCTELQSRLQNLESLAKLLQDAAASYDELMNNDDGRGEPEFDCEVSLSQLITDLITNPRPAVSKGPPMRPPAPTSTPRTPHEGTPTGEDIVADLFWGNAVAADPHLRSVSAPPIEAMDPSIAAALASKPSGPPARPPPPKKAMTPIPNAAGHYTSSAMQPMKPMSASADPFAASPSAFPPATTNDPFASSQADPFKSSGADPFSDDGFAAAFGSSGAASAGFDDDDAWAVRK